MSLTCSQSFTIAAATPAGGDMPFDQAVYGNSTVAGGPFIWAVRGGFVYKLNATTGAKISSARYVCPSFGDASIAYDAVNDKIFCSFWNEQRADDGATATLEALVYKGIYRLNPSTLAVEVSSLVFPLLPGSENTQTWYGPHQILAYSGFIYGAYYGQTGVHATGVFEFDPLAMAATIAGDQVQGLNQNAWTDLCVQPASGPNDAQLWISVAASQSVSAKDFSDLTNSSSPYYDLDETAAGFPTPYPIVYGVCWSPVDGRIYGTCRSQTLVYFPPKTSGMGVGDSFKINTGDTNAFPYRIRYCDQATNPFYQKMIVPGYKSNNVVVVTPGTPPTFVIKTGFDSPFDVVFTPTKTFAVQQSDTGLKEIT